MPRNLNVYILHANWLKDRQRVVEEFQKQIQKYFFKDIKQTKIQVITDFDPNDINGELIQRTVNYAHYKEEDDIKEDNKTTSITFYNQFIKNMHLFQLSNVLKHLKALEFIMKNSSDDDINIILEDDIVYQEKMCMTLEKVFDSLPSDYDMVFMGLPTNRQIKNPDDITYQNTSEVFRVLPYCDSYIVSKNAATKLYNNFLPIKFTSNLQLSSLIEKLSLKTVLCIPSIFIDGSKFGLFLSTLTPNNALLFNADYMQSKQLLDTKKDVELTSEEIEKLEKIFETSPIKNHPDFMHVKAQYLVKQNKFTEAEAVFEAALKIYQANSCVVNHESAFLKEYIKLFKELQ